MGLGRTVMRATAALTLCLLMACVHPAHGQFTSGDVLTGTQTVPAQPNTPTPANGATGISLSPTLSAVSSGATSCTLLYGTTNPPLISGGSSATCVFSLTGLAETTPYFWQITGVNSIGGTPGPVWTFTTLTSVPPGVHPLVQLTPTLIATLQAKLAAGDADAVAFKNGADVMAGGAVFTGYTFTSCTNANPVECTIVENVPFASMDINIGGGTGNWAPINHLTPVTQITATRTGTHTFTIPVNSTTFGSFSGQTLAMFPVDGSQDYAFYNGVNGKADGWRVPLITLGTVYRMTGSATYCTKARELIRYIAAVGAAGITTPVAGDSGYPSRFLMPGISQGFDFCYPTLTSQEKTDLITAGNLWYDWYTANGLDRTGPAVSNYFGGHTVGFGMWGLVTTGDNARSAEITAHVRAVFDSVVGDAFSTGAWAGGYPTESYVYGINQFTDYILPYMDAVRTATGENLFSGTDYAQKIATNLIHALKPNKWQVTDEADQPGSWVGTLQAKPPLYLAALLDGTTEGGWMQFLYNNLAVSPYGGQVDDAYARLLYGKTGRTAIDYTASQPLFYYSPGDGHLLWRSGWGTSDVWAQFKAGTTYYAGHESRAAGNVEIQRGSDYFLVNSGQWKGPSGVSNDLSGIANFDLLGWRSNALCHGDGGVYNYTGTHYKCGMGFWGTNDVKAHEGGADYAYLKGDLTSAYYTNDFGVGAHSVSSYRRSTMMEGTGVVVVFDRAVFTGLYPTEQFWWHFNPNCTLTIVSTTTKCVLGSSVLYMKTLSPASATIAQTTDPHQDDLDNDGHVDLTATTKRVTVTDAAPGTTLQGLHAFYAAASSVSSMPTTTKITSTGGTMVGLSIDDGSTTWVNLFAVDGTAQDGVTYAATIGSTGRHVLADLTAGHLYRISQNGTDITARLASTQGVVEFTSTGGGTFVLTPTTSRPDINFSGVGVRTAALITPTDGETFVAPAELRLIGLGYDQSVFTNVPSDGLGTNADHVDFYVDDTKVLTVTGANAEYDIFKGRTTGLAAGSHVVWARAVYVSPAATIDSVPHTITVSAPPTYGSTITLSADLALTGAYALVGTAGALIKLDCANHQLTGTVTSFTWQYVDIVRCGDATSTGALAADITTTGNITIDHVRFDQSNPFQFTQTGTGTATITNNLWRSSMRQPLGQTPDTGGGQLHGSYPVLLMKGTSTGLKVFEGNNGAAGWWDFQSPNWTIGGTTVAKTNVAIGARVGFWLSVNATATIQRNFTHHVYYGGWSQGSNYELGGVCTLVEHNIIIGSSWPVRGVNCEYRYNLTIGPGGEEGHVWTANPSSTAFIHHNIMWGWTDPSRGTFYDIYDGSNVRFLNNTIDNVDNTRGSPAQSWFGANGTGPVTGTAKNNLLLRNGNSHVIAFGTGATITTDYNGFYQNAGTHYSDGRAPPAHDFTANPLLTAPPTTFMPINELSVWGRTLSVASILATWRGYYTPTAGSPAIDTGDTSVFGAGTDIGAIGAGTSNASDLFGTLTD